MKKIFIATLAILLAACASDPAKRQEVAVEEAARMHPTEVPLGEFTRFELAPMQMSEAVSSRAEKADVARELGAKLNARLQPLLRGWEAAVPAGKPERVARIEPKVASLRVVSGGARFWAGGLVGDSFIDLDIKITDLSTGNVIGNQRINRNANAIAGAWSIGASDRNLSDYIVDIAHQYLQENHAPPR